MPRHVPLPIRQTIWNRFQDGQDVRTIAKDLDLSLRTVRRLFQRFRSENADPLATSYDRCGVATPKPIETLVQAVLELRREHPTWGAGLIRVMLRRNGLDGPLPATRTLQRWLLRADLAPAPPGRRPSSDTLRAARPHEVWQMDAAELVPLQTGQRVCWLRIVDECSGAVLWTEVFPPGPLEPGLARVDPGSTPPGLRPLGPTRSDPGRQWDAVGFGAGRPADGPRTVAGRDRGRYRLQPSGNPPGQWGG
ncbi:Homeodomain-like domain-containing protein [Singulisphaera sp. GP187]|nr:Homeodomain-like domain-containing protein [Singulisphaera sp. GP187]SIO65067.1 Homeodomain-like domain-containing protein [Singulisphaera sp. GP187]